ncbi:Rab3 GTPase-activating protein catalytic subunit [Trichinella pseudospiralis]
MKTSEGLFILLRSFRLRIRYSSLEIVYPVSSTAFRTNFWLFVFLIVSWEFQLFVPLIYTKLNFNRDITIKGHRFFYSMLTQSHHHNHGSKIN